MSFEISARTILHLGADLISSDAVALYELIKNSIDARSDTGVDVAVEIVIKASDFAAVVSLAEAGVGAGMTVEKLKSEVRKRIQSDAPEELKSEFLREVEASKSLSQFKLNFTSAYRFNNRIIVSDTGHGMSVKDLKDIYLTIGTTSRTRDVLSAVKDGEKAPFLGEKGVGRLSAMRLGKHLRVETATADDERVNVLVIDWTEFEKAFDKPANSVVIKPFLGEKKAKGKSFTKIIISDLVSSWSYGRLMEIARSQIARMMDPFSWAGRRRFQIRMSLNDVVVEQVRVVAEDLLKSSHATCSGKYEMTEGGAKLTLNFASKLYDGPIIQHTFDSNDLLAMSGVKAAGYPVSILRSLGDFDFEFYWFNRQRLKATPGVGDREVVRALIKAWSGICLFRDGYRVLPYGDEGDDWLGLDREALSASGYKLNTKQLIGRVAISRTGNSKLLDQTNRQGLKDCPEKDALIELLNTVVSRWWHDYLDEAGKAQKVLKDIQYDPSKEGAAVGSLEQRIRTSLKSIRKDFKGDGELLEQVKDAFIEIKDAHTRAVARINAMEEEKERLTQLAGVGLLIEVIAHELTRATELTQMTLKSIDKQSIDAETTAAFRVLGEQIKVIQKRLYTLEPLSVSARQRRSKQNLGDIVKYIIEGHTAQFDRHEINVEICGDRKVIGFVIEGHIVQILENLINNSLYWIDVYRYEHPGFIGEISVELLSSPPRIRYSDNGPGIPISRVESVFDPFFSTKKSSSNRRQGLGLYIARQNAELLGGGLYLVDEGSLHTHRFNTFELELKESAE
ncbi:sensor histidine kinase [Pseudomonas helleri]|uniref:histidine kinase n=1 Tax=Pseudomonas helleri TaxID=1608996 RepID=A0A7X2BW21_9PSED|nr:sensor histidine kinase [Pseudomonas helleri]MQT77258.1 RstB [Pseudomonas helleri]